MPVRVVKIEGGPELKRALERLQVNVQNVLEEAVQAGAQVIMDAANDQAPGPNVRMETEEKTADSVTVAIGPDKDHWYYKFLESGAQPHEISSATALVFEGDSGIVVTRAVAHTGMAARPFLRPAVDENEGKATEAVGDVIRRAVE